jgi:hypothetical protein
MNADTTLARRPAAFRALLADGGAIADAVRRAAAAVPHPVSDLVRRLLLLRDLPFTALVPDARAIPPESVRFFIVDQNWVDALIDGVLATAVRSGPDVALMEQLRPGVRSAPRSAVTGFLMRSAAVAHWPDLRVTGFADPAGQQRLDLLRSDRPADTILAVLFDGVVARVSIATPAQGLGFGIAGDSSGQIALRGMGGRFACGEPLPGVPPVEVPLRDDPDGRAIVDVQRLHTRMSAALSAAYAPGPAPVLGPAGFGLQLIASGEVLILAGDGWAGR